MKRIVFFTGTNDLYGANRILINTLSLFAGHERILCVPQKGPLTELVEATHKDVRIMELPSIPVIAKIFINPKGLVEFSSKLLKFSRELKKVVSKDSVIYLNTLAVLPVAWFVKNKKYLHVHEILSNKSRLNRFFNKLALSSMDRVICVSKAVSDNLKEVSCARNSSKLVTVHNGIEAIRIDESGIKDKGDGKIRIVLIGRIRPQIKGHDYVIDAIKELPEHLERKIEVAFVGSPVQSQEEDLYNLQKRIKDENLDDIVAIHGFTNEISEFYENADICLVPSVRADPFPTTVLEAMSAGLPVIGTNIGGIPEMITDGQTGYMVPVDDVATFAKKLAILIEDGNKRREMGAKGRDRFFKEFAINSYDKRYRDALPEMFN